MPMHTQKKTLAGVYFFLNLRLSITYAWTREYIHVWYLCVCVYVGACIFANFVVSNGRYWFRDFYVCYSCTWTCGCVRVYGCEHEWCCGVHVFCILHMPSSLAKCHSLMLHLCIYACMFFHMHGVLIHIKYDSINTTGHEILHPVSSR